MDWLRESDRYRPRPIRSTAARSPVSDSRSCSSSRTRVSAKVQNAPSTVSAVVGENRGARDVRRRLVERSALYHHANVLSRYGDDRPKPATRLGRSCPRLPQASRAATSPARRAMAPDRCRPRSAQTPSLYTMRHSAPTATRTGVGEWKQSRMTVRRPGDQLSVSIGSRLRVSMSSMSAVRRKIANGRTNQSTRER